MIVNLPEKEIDSRLSHSRRETFLLKLLKQDMHHVQPAFPLVDRRKCITVEIDQRGYIIVELVLQIVRILCWGPDRRYKRSHGLDRVVKQYPSLGHHMVVAARCVR